MHIAITGTRGIPARHGGFETFAQELALRLTAAGHAVTVYNPSFHPWSQASWEGIRLVRKAWPSTPAGVLWYDRLCMRDAYRRRPDVILNCGYGNALFIRKDHPVPVVTLTDGLEWKRAGWPPPARAWLRAMERMAVRRSRRLVSDHPEIARHYRDTYGTDTPVIPYGAAIPDTVPLPAGTTPGSLLETYQVGHHTPAAGTPAEKITPGNYFLTVGRFVPENNLEMILKAYRRTGITAPLLVVGNYGKRYGKRLKKDYGTGSNIFFAGSIYDKPLLDVLRRHARGYLHGHSAGGTNPALLEAMAAGSLIAAHDNPFNRYVLGEGAPFFSSAGELAELLSHWDSYLQKKREITEKNLEKIRKDYSWERITDLYLKLFSSLPRIS